MLRRVSAVFVAVLVWTTPATGAGAADQAVAAVAPYSILGIVSEPEDMLYTPEVAAQNQWTGKNVATETFYHNVFEPSWAMTIWNKNAIPTWAYYIPGRLDAIATGYYDATITNDIVNMRTFLQGPDLVYGTGDDRRIYIRLAYEPDVATITYSPCNPNAGGDAATFIQMWRRVWYLYRNAGIDSSHAAFMFTFTTAAPAAPSPCSPESLYPGPGYVDWVGMDGYNVHNTGVWSWPADVFGPITQRLRNLAPGKPVAITEAGTGSIHTGKLAWITAYFDWAYANDIRMIMWFNYEKVEDNGLNYYFTAFDSTYTGAVSPPDAYHRYCQLPLCLGFTDYRAYSTYRTGVQRPWVRGSDSNNPRLLPTNIFLGQ